jgi:hypothetical protein
MSDFVDPVIEASTGGYFQRLAAFEPVTIASRPYPIADSGWLVIVSETQKSTSATR